MDRADILSVEDLSLGFSRFHKMVPVVENVSFAVKKGEKLAIVGESGSGKTVTVRRIMHLLPKVQTLSGKICLRSKDGQVRDITQLSNSEASKIRGAEIAMIFQEPMSALNPTFTIGNQIQEAIAIHQQSQQSRAKALELLELVRIPEAKQRLGEYPHQMSGGMRQRVMIAMALACNPQILLADEPTTALDVTIQAQVLALISSLHKELGMSLVLITHDMSVVGQLADRVLVMYKGKLVESGDVGSLFSSPQHPYTQALLQAVPRLGSMQGLANPMTFPLLKMTEQLGENALATPPQAVEINTACYHKQPILQIENLQTSFVSKKNFWGSPTHLLRAVEQLSIAVYPGETLSIVGESGCGKTTTGYSIGKLVGASGKIFFAGKDILCMSAKEFRGVRKDIQMVFQDPYSSLNPRMTVGASIAEPLIINKLGTKAQRRQRVRELMEQVDLPPSYASRYPHEFSGGQRQRIAIARALATHPKLIIADEAVSALDISIQAMILNLMMELQRELGLTYVFISHDMAVVERVSHRVAVMYLGQIVETGSRRDIFEDPQHPYTKKLLAAVPNVPKGEPAQRSEFVAATGEIPSPVYPIGSKPKRVLHREVSPGHLVGI